MDPLRVVAVQTDLIWQNPEANRQRLAEKLAPIAGTTDLIVLPEMFTTGFSMQPAGHAELHPGDTAGWMLEQAALLQAAICGSVMVEESGKYYNRAYWAAPDGSLQWYDKRHLFSLAGENDAYTPGRDRLIVEYRGWRICPLICYDLRFPVYSRNDVDYDLLIYSANWPDARAYAWKHLLIARAIENQTYVIGVNRIGSDENGLHYSGSSCIISSLGEVYNQYSSEEALIEGLLWKSNLEEIKQKLPFLKDSDYFAIDLDRRSFSGRFIS